MKPDPYASFAEAVLKKRREPRPKNPHVSVANIEELLQSAGRAFPLVTIHREQVNPDACWIGRVLGVSGDRVSLLKISPDATWDGQNGRINRRGASYWLLCYLSFDFPSQLVSSQELYRMD